MITALGLAKSLGEIHLTDKGSLLNNGRYLLSCVFSVCVCAWLVLSHVALLWRVPSPVVSTMQIFWRYNNNDFTVHLIECCTPPVLMTTAALSSEDREKWWACAACSLTTLLSDSECLDLGQRYTVNIIFSYIQLNLYRYGIEASYTITGRATQGSSHHGLSGYPIIPRSLCSLSKVYCLYIVGLVGLAARIPTVVVLSGVINTGQLWLGCRWTNKKSPQTVVINKVCYSATQSTVNWQQLGLTQCLTPT